MALPMPCKEPGCPNVTKVGRCKAHTREHDRRRGSSTERGYDRQWRKVRTRVMRERGWRCEECGVRPADTSTLHGHHVVPLADDGARLDPDNVRVLCETCHPAEENRNLPGPPSRRPAGGSPRSATGSGPVLTGRWFF